MSGNSFFIVFVIYISFLVGMSWLFSRRHQSGDDFLLGNRDLPILLTLGTTVATMVGTGSSMGAVGYGYENGWAGGLYGIGGALGILLLGLWFAPVRNLRFITMSEEIAYYVGASKMVKNLMACLIYAACIGWLGAHILGGGMYLSWITGIHPTWAKLMVAIGFSGFTLIGGYLAVVWTDSIQTIVLFVGFILIAIAAIIKVGGLDMVIAAQPPANQSFLAIGKIGLLPALSLIFVITIGVLATPSFRQRIYSGRNVTTIRKSFYWSGAIYLVFSLVPALIGMGAFALSPELENRNFAFPFLALNVLPAVFGGLFLLAGLSATMSSASSDAIAAVSVLMRDISVIVFGRVPAHDQVVWYSRLAMVLTVSLATMLAITSDDVISYITQMIATLMSGIFVCCLLGHCWPRFNAWGAVAALLGGSAGSFTIIIQENWLAYWGNPIIPAVSCSLVAAIAVSMCTPALTISRAESLKRLVDEREAMEVVQGIKTGPKTR